VPPFNQASFVLQDISLPFLKAAAPFYSFGKIASQ
jgi:hypothetical protein